MAILSSSRTRPPIVIDRFLGINQDPTEANLLLGEASKILNYRITDNYKLSKRDGYEELFESLGVNKPIRGMWYGKIGSVYHFLFACDGHIYKHDLTTHTNTSIGTLTDDITSFFTFDNKLYIINGHEYKSWDGTTFATVTGYRPKIAITTPPTGGGTPYENINALTGAKCMTFSGNGSATTFQLSETNITTIDYVKTMTKVNGQDVWSTVTPASFSLTNGTVTLSVAPVNNVPDNVEIGWTKGTGDRTFVEQMKYACIYGGKSDFRVFLYGKDNLIIYSDLASGVPSAEYFPVFNYKNIGSDFNDVTGLIRHGDRLLICSDTDTYYCYYDTIQDDLGNTVPDFPIYPLNSKKGNVAPNQLQLIKNNPFVIAEGVYEWLNTDVRDERAIDYKSQRVQPSLDTVDLTKAITVDWEEKGEYWLCVGDEVWVYNYRNDTWYPYDNIPAKCFIVIGGKLYFGTNDGQIMVFDKDRRNDNGTVFKAVWEMGFLDCGANWLRKYTNRIYTTLKPEARSVLDIKYKTDKSSYSETVTAQYNLATFVNLSFADMSFKTNYNPQPFSFSINANDYTYLKFVLITESIDETVTVISLSIPFVTGGNV